MAEPKLRVILTRPIEQAKETRQTLQQLLPESTEIILSPLIEIVRLSEPPDPAAFAGVIFTSRNGVRFAGAGTGIPAYCVGPATTQAARAAGWNAVEAGKDAAELVEFIIRKGVKSPLAHLAGRHTRGDIAARLTSARIVTREYTLYDQILRPLSTEAKAALKGGKPVIVPLYSPRTAGQFRIEFEGTAPVYVVGMSAAVMEEFGALPVKARIMAQKPDARHMEQALRYAVLRVEADASAT